SPRSTPFPSTTLFRSSVVGVGGFARLFTDVVQAEAAEAARRDAAELRAVTLLARAAAHEINNALMVVAGGLAILARRLPADSERSEEHTSELQSRGHL